MALPNLERLLAPAAVGRPDSFYLWTLLLALSLLVLARVFWPQLNAVLRFAWHCFLRPIGAASNQKAHLDQFYAGQADVYDQTRSGLLRGRSTMLSLCAAHLRVLRAANPNKKLVWVDIGGGTGYNIELMHRNFCPVSEFDHVYLIDLCEPLLQVARQRFAKLGFTNVTVLCQDASAFTLPEWEDGVLPRGSVGFVTLSYALSMIPSFFTLLDRIDHVLDPQDGLIGVVDFYTSGKTGSLHERAIGGERKECGWLSRWFWLIWFDFDKVYLSQRREYLEHKFGTIKSYNGRNKFVLPFIVRIPYYIWLGRSRSCDVSRFCHAFEVESGNYVGNCSPENTPRGFATVDYPHGMPPLDIGEAKLPIAPRRRMSNAIVDITPPLSSFHYQLKHPYRLPYYQSPVHKEFRTFIYSFTWEDPEEDMRHLDLSSEDSMLVITSAGDNALHYAIAAQPKRIHCVDMNPCQAHLLELKLSAVQALPFADFFALFGYGKHASFRRLLDEKISPFLSSTAYQFWRINATAFARSFYLRGYAGWALRLARWIFALTRTRPAVRALCAADNVAEQETIWQTQIRPVLLNPVVVWLLQNPVFCWNALGVPRAQRAMFLAEGSAYEFVRDTLDPIPGHALLKRGAYHYLLTLLGHYTPDSCPEYLTTHGYDTLRADDGKVLDAFRLHTDSIVNVLAGLPDGELTRAVLMDHLDWFAPGSEEVNQELEQLYRGLAPGGKVLWRSAAKMPWYAQTFREKGFIVERISVRDEHTAIDRVNMYASFWSAVKPVSG